MEGGGNYIDASRSGSRNTSTAFADPDETAGKEQEGNIGAIEMGFDPIDGEDLLEGFDFDFFGKGE